MSGMMPNNGSNATFGHLDTPRIRHITSIRIHKLTYDPSQQDHILNHDHSHIDAAITKSGLPGRSNSQGSVRTLNNNLSIDTLHSPGIQGYSISYPHLDISPNPNNPIHARRRSASATSTTQRGNSRGDRGLPSRPGLANRRSRFMIPAQPAMRSPGLSASPDELNVSSFIDSPKLNEDTQEKNRTSSTDSDRMSVLGLPKHTLSHDHPHRRDRANTLLPLVMAHPGIAIENAQNYTGGAIGLDGKAKTKGVEGILRRCWVSLSLVDKVVKPEETRINGKGMTGAESGVGTDDSMRADESVPVPTTIKLSTSRLNAKTKPALHNVDASSPNIRRPSSLASKRLSSSSTTSTLSSTTSTLSSRSSLSVSPGKRNEEAKPSAVRAGSFSGRSQRPGEPSKAIASSPVLLKKEDTPRERPANPSGREKDSKSSQRKIGDVKIAVKQADGVPKEAPSSVQADSIPNLPFYISPIHPPSTLPTFSDLTPRADFASWLVPEELAAQVIRLEVWVEVSSTVDQDVDDDNDSESNQLNDRDWCANGSQTTTTRRSTRKGKRWKKLPSRETFDLKEMKPVTEPTEVPPNSLIMTFANHGDMRYCLPVSLGEDWNPVGTTGINRRIAVDNAVERSLRETKMRKGVTLAGLHDLLRLESGIRQAQKENIDVQSRLAGLIASISDTISLERTIDRQRLELTRLKQAVNGSRSRAESARSRIAERRSAIELTRRELADAAPRIDQLQESSVEVDKEIHATLRAKNEMLYKSYEDRARATSVLDTIFPIIPVDPQRLLYTILGVALPIPQLPADKVPPLYLPSNALPSGVKVDEESNATALGYVAMVISHLSLIMDKPLLYPVTCIGSRSLVRDYISVISGTRSFPLYAKGVERYRYDYAVFLLNKNIETLMVDANIKIEDMRHTLPNLKTLLLVVASNISPPVTMLNSLVFDKTRTSSGGARIDKGRSSIHNMSTV